MKFSYIFGLRHMNVSTCTTLQSRGDLLVGVVNISCQKVCLLFRCTFEATGIPLQQAGSSQTGKPMRSQNSSMVETNSYRGLISCGGSSQLGKSRLLLTPRIVKLSLMHRSYQVQHISLHNPFFLWIPISLSHTEHTTFLVASKHLGVSLKASSFILVILFFNTFTWECRQQVLPSCSLQVSGNLRYLGVQGSKSNSPTGLHRYLSQQSRVTDSSYLRLRLAFGARLKGDE
ncbi:hypothetical protein FGO68_gene17516 [Halteria grandinella]|uniref:Uncharacterized protein n=1 Tax=Halteria grandinella TaxID=5974 RepID=A0A8J8NR47_HALGN|nr:hypothetical protein FGO68_gene17516 [Halteria grandinella]